MQYKRVRKIVNIEQLKKKTVTLVGVGALGSFIALLFNLISLWAITRMRDDQLQAVKKIWSRLNYVEVGMSYHGMIPMPWEVEEVEDYVRDIKSFKQEGNIVYLPEEGEKNASIISHPPCYDLCIRRI